jgi:hypothetical protein
MPLLGQLGIVERLIRLLEIGAAVLPVRIEKQCVKALVQIVVMRHIVARAAARIELREPPPEVAQQPLRARPERRLAAVFLRHRKREEVRDRALLDHQRAVHVGFADGELGIGQNRPFGRRMSKPGRDRCSGAVAEFQGRSARGRQPQRSASDVRPQDNLQHTIHRPPQTSRRASRPRQRFWKLGRGRM